MLLIELADSLILPLMSGLVLGRLTWCRGQVTLRSILVLALHLLGCLKVVYKGGSSILFKLMTRGICDSRLPRAESIGAEVLTKECPLVVGAVLGKG